MSKVFKIVLMACAIVLILAISGSMIYYFVFFRPEKERAEIRLQEEELEFEKEKQRAEEQEELDSKEELAEQLTELNNWYNESLEEAYENFRENWYNECVSRGLQPDSPLPQDIAEILEERYMKEIEIIKERYEGAKDEIYRLYD